MEESSQLENINKSSSQLCFVKLLINNLVAGSVIGKSGAIITGIENNTGCSIKLSPANSYFPNTQERVLVLCGKLKQVHSALLIILDKIREVTTHRFNDVKNAEPNSQKYTCRIVVPKSAVSAIIGKGGQQIKQLQDSMGSKIQISSREDGLNERIITIGGTFKSISDTALNIVNSIQSDPNLKDLLNVVYTKDTKFMNSSNTSRMLSQNYMNHMHMNGYMLPQHYGLFQHEHFMDTTMMNTLMRHNADLYNIPCEISIQIPDEFIGSLIGKNGTRLTSIMNTTGAQIRISRKGELIPGTTDRKVRIIGPVAAVHSAHVLLLHRLETTYMQVRNTPVKCMDSTSQ